MLRIAPLLADPATLTEASALLVRALPHDRVDVVCAEKLFGDDGARRGRALGAWEGERLVGVMAQAGRWVKLLAVAPEHRRAGIGQRLLDEAGAQASRLRIGDHPGNYLSPGVDERYAEGIAWLEKRGFVERERVENLRVPYAGNERVSAARADALVAAAAEKGYRIAVPTAAELPYVLQMIASSFAAVWANEAAHAYAGPRRALFVAFDDREGGEAPIAFAAADGNNQGLGWFGPAGTLEAHRGHKLGEALLLRCLVAVAGLPEAGVIAWIGPRAFYERAAGARSDRCFVQLERA
jgi:GNAT superfamily N-acetyltransferase